LPRPVLGLVGQLSERIDLDILTAISDAGFSLLLVGPRDPRWEAERFAELTSRPGVHYTGRVPAASVPAYLAAIDVGITPYTASDFNLASFPLKTLEYLAAGRPVVSTDLPGARWLLEDLARAGPAVTGEPPAEIMTLASTPAEFVSAVHRMVPGPRGGEEQARREQCRAFATRHSWARRADALAAAIGFRPATAESRPGQHVPQSG